MAPGHANWNIYRRMSAVNRDTPTPPPSSEGHQTLHRVLKRTWSPLRRRKKARSKNVQQFWIVGKTDTRPISPGICGFVASCSTAAGGQCGITAWFSVATVNRGDIGHVTLIKTFQNLLRRSGGATTSRLRGHRRNSTPDPGFQLILCVGLSGLSPIGRGACQDPRGGFAVMNLNRGRVRRVRRDAAASNLIRSKQEVTNKRNCQPRCYRGWEEAEAAENFKKKKKAVIASFLFRTASLSTKIRRF